MTTASFHARVERINLAHSKTSARGRGGAVATQMHAPQQAYAAARGTARRRSFGMRGLVMPIIAGLTLGGLAGLLQLAVTTDGSPIGPGTEFNQELFIAALAGLAVSPLLMLASLVLQGRNPRLSLLALSYLSGLVLTLLM